MPQETSPWNRRELKRERSEPVARWRGSPSYQGGSRLFQRASEPRKRTGHGKQGVWHLYSEEPGHKYAHPRSFSRTIAMRGDGKHNRDYRDNRGSYAPREYRGGQSSESSRGSFSTMPKQPDNGDILRDQHDKRNDANQLSPAQRVDEKRLVDSVDWKPRRWMHKGSLPSRDSGLHHSSAIKSAICWAERNDESQSKTTVSLQSSMEKVADGVFSTEQSEGLASKKKPRLGWGEGLAKYEKKKVEGPVGSLLEAGGGSNQSFCLDAADRASGILGILDRASPATSSSALSSISTMEDRLLETMEMSGHIDNLSDLPVSSFEKAHQEFSIDKEKLDIDSNDRADPSLVQLLPSRDISLDSGFAVSTLMDSSMFMKDDVVKALLKTDSEIELLENELKSIASESGGVCASSISDSFTFKDNARCSIGQDDVASIIPQPATSQIVSPGDTGVGEMCYIKGTNSDYHVTDTVSVLEKDNHLENESAAESALTEMEKVLPGSSREGTIKPFEHVKIPDDAESKLCELILSSNRECASRASSEVFNNLLLKDQDKLDVAKIGIPYCQQVDSRARVKFNQRKRFLIFKERVLALKFKAFHHLWKKDMHLLSLRSGRPKSWKKLESSLRIKLGGCQKPRSSLCARVFSSGTMSVAPNKEIIRYMSKMLKDSHWRIYREALKMPALILDEREKNASRFISYNGLVEDPCAVEKERTMINPWTVEEREIFMEKLGKFGKDFRRISSFLDHKTTADCVEFYYKNHKSEFFQGVKKNLDTVVQPKLPSANIYLITSGKMRDREVNAVSLDLLSGASLVASQDQAGAGSGEEDSGGCYGRSILHPCCSSRSLRIDALDDEREALAADVLTEIRSSVVQVKSCREKYLSDWTDVEKSMFIQGVSLYGKDFAMISNYLKTRSKDQCRAFFNKARKCLRLDLMLPVLAGKPLNGDVSVGGDDMDGPEVMKNGTLVGEDNLVDDKDQDLHVSVKLENTDAVDCGSSTDLKETARGSGSMGSQVCEEKGLGTSLKSHDLLHEVDLNEQVSDQSPRAMGRWSAHAAADSSPCSVFSLSSEFKDQSPVEADQVEKPPLAIITDSASFRCAEMKTQYSNQEPEIWKQSNHGSEGNMRNMQELGNPVCSGDFKLFGKRILTGMPSHKYPDSDIHGEDKKGGPKELLNLTGSSNNRGRNSSVLKFDPNDHEGLENIPIGSYGFWDGTRVRTVPSLSDSAFLLAKYPAAFSKHPLQEVAKSSECNIYNSNSQSVIPAWDITVKQRHDASLEMQRRNGLDAMPGPKQQGGSGMVGANIGARGVLVGGSRTDLSDPVAAIKMHYALVNQVLGQGVSSLNREDSQRDATDMKT